MKNGTGDEHAWEEFTELYRPVIVRLALARGLQEADAQDLAQQVFVSVHGAIGRWVPNSEGVRFRNWLSKITRNAILKTLTRRPADAARGGSEIISLMAEVKAPDGQLREQLEDEIERELYLRASEMVQQEVNARSWQAFQWTSLEEVSIEEAAKRLNQSVGSVYAMRSRVMRRLRDVVRILREIEQ